MHKRTDLRKRDWLVGLFLLIALGGLSIAAAQAGPRRGATVRLVPDRPVARAIKGAETHLYVARVKAGQFLRVTVMQRGVDVVVSVYGPGGSLLAKRDRPNDRYGEESLSVEVPAEGAYRIEVKPFASDVQEGRYEIRLERPRAATALDRRRLAAEQTFQEAETLRLERKKESWEAAIPKYEKAAAAWHEIEDYYAEAVARSTLSGIYGGLKQTDKAIEAELLAYSIYLGLGNKRGQGDSLLHIGQHLRNKGQLDTALRFYEQSVEAKRAAQDAEGESLASRGTAEVLSLLGDSQNKNGDKEKAAESYRRAISLYKAAGNDRGVADVLDRLERMSFGDRPELVRQTGRIGLTTSVAHSPTDPVIASADRDSVILWSTRTGHKLRSFPCDVASIGGNILLRHNPLAGAAFTGDCQLVFSPDGRYLTSVSISNLINQKVLNQKKWDVLTGKETVDRFILNPTKEENSPYETVAVSPDGTRGAAANSNNGSITVIDFEDGQRHFIENKAGRAHLIRFTSDSQTVAAFTNNQTVTLWDVSSGRKARSFEDCRDVFAISRQGKLLACGAPDNSINLWDIATGVKLPGPAGRAGKVISLTFSPDDRKLISGRDDKSLTIWDLADGGKLGGSTGDRITTGAVAFSPDGTRLVVGADETVGVWSVGEAKELQSFTNGRTGVDDVAVSNRRNLLAICFDNKVELWDLSSIKRVRTFTAGNSLSAVAFSRDGSVVAAGGWGKNVTLWDVETGRARTIGSFDRYVGHIIFSPEDDKIAVRSQMSVEIKIADVKTGNIITTQEALTITLSDDSPGRSSSGGKLPAWADFDKFEQRREVIERDGVQTLVAHTLEEVVFLDPTTRRELASFSAAGPNDWLVTTPEGFFDGTADAWKKAIWRFDNDTFDYGAVELYFNEFFLPDLLQEVLAGKAPRPIAGRELVNRDRRQPVVKIVSTDGESKEETNVQPAHHPAGRRPAVAVTVEVTDGTGEKKQAAHDATSGARDLRLFRNGSLVKVWHGDLFNLEEASGCEQIRPAAPNQPRRVRCRAVVPITGGDNTFTAYAFNSSNVKSNDDVSTFNSLGGPERRGTFYVLAVGVNDYLRAGKLTYAVDDAVELAAALRREQGKLGVYDSAQVITLTDAEASKKNILLALTRFGSDAGGELPPGAPTQLRRIRTLAPEDALVIVFSGHGEADTESFYLLPPDADSVNLRESGVSDGELNDVLEQVDAGQLLLIIDACQSGKALGQGKDGRGPMNAKGLAQLAYDKGMSILAAAQSYQAALEASRTLTGKDIRHGLLTFALLGGLTDKKATDASGNVLERAWFDYAVGEVPRLQIEEMKKRQGKSSRLSFVANGGRDNEPERHVQVPRVFYRREENTRPLIVAKP